jgi:hypothetical protein
VAGLLSVDEAFGEDALAPQSLPQDGRLPTADEVFGASEPNFAATIDKNLQASIFHITNAFEVGLREGFGSAPIATPATVLSKETEADLRRLGIFNDYAKGQADFSRAMFEGVFKGTAAGLAIAMRAGTAILSAPLEALDQAGAEVGIPGLTGEAGLRGALTDPGLMMALGPFGEYTALPTIAKAQRAANFYADLSKARAVGAIGEGEAGFYDAGPLKPQDAEARGAAANEAGIPPEAPVPPPDVHELARRIEPEAFKKYDARVLEIEQLRVALEGLGPAVTDETSLGIHKRLVAAVHGLARRIEPEAFKKYDARVLEIEQLRVALEGLGPAVTDETSLGIHKRLVAAQIALADLMPEVSAAYRQAREMMPEAPVIAEAVQVASEGKPPPEVTKPTEPVATEAQLPPTLQPQAAAAGKGASGALRPVKGTGETVTRTLAEGVEAKAIENTLTTGFGDLPEYRRLSMADQAAKAAEHIAKDPESAKAIAMGEKPAPAGVLPESIFVAVEKRALAEGDVETLRQLATESRLTTAATTMGQRIRTLRERDPASPVGAIHEVQEARRADLEKRGGFEAARKATVEDIKRTVRKSASPRPTWEAFIESITCPE